MKKSVTQIKRVALPLLVVLAVAGLYLSGAYLAMPKALDSLSSSAIRACMGLVVIHMFRKVAFESLVWTVRVSEMTAGHLLVVVLYATFPYAVSVGG